MPKTAAPKRTKPTDPSDAIGLLESDHRTVEADLGMSGDMQHGIAIGGPQRCLRRQGAGLVGGVKQSGHLLDLCPGVR